MFSLFIQGIKVRKELERDMEHMQIGYIFLVIVKEKKKYWISNSKSYLGFIMPGWLKESQNLKRY